MIFSFIKKTNKYFSDLILPFLLYLILACLFMYPLFNNQVLVFMDNFLNISPMYNLWRSELSAGRIPLWNPYVFAGIPFIGDTSHPIFNPFNLFYFLLPNVFLATNIQLLFLLALLSLGGFYLSRQFDLSKPISWICGFALGFSGTAFHDINDLNSLTALAFMPWIVSFYIQFIHQPNIANQLKLTIFGVLVLLSGHTQYLYYLFIFLCLFAIEHFFSHHLYQHPRKLITFLANHFLIGWFVFTLSGISLIPSLELLSHVRRSAAIDQHTIHSEPILSFFRVFMPTLFGQAKEGNSWGPGTQLEYGMAATHGFMNISILVWSIIGFSHYWHKPYTKSLFFISLTAFILSFGQTTPAYNLASQLLPGFEYFRSPTRIFSIYHLSMIPMAGLGLHQIISHRLKYTRLLSRLGLTTLIIALLSLILLFFKPSVFSPLFKLAYTTIKQQAIYSSVSYPPAKIDAISFLILRACLLFGIGFAPIVLSINQFSRKNIFWGLLASIMITESFFNVRGNLIFAPLSSINFNQPVVDFLTKNLDNQRFISTSETQPFEGIWNYYFHLFVRPPFSQTSINDYELQTWNQFSIQTSLLPSNLNMLHNLQSSAGYVALIPNIYRQYTNSKSLNKLDFQDFKHPAISKFATKYILTNTTNDTLKNDTSDNYLPVFQNHNLIIYQNLSAQPRAELLDKQDVQISSLHIDQKHPQALSLNTQSSVSATLVLRDLYYPGWKAYIDNQPTPILPYDQIFRSVELPSGHHRVDFFYRPQSFILGAGISLIGLLSLLLYIKYHHKLTLIVS